MATRYTLDDLSAALEAGVIDAATSERLARFLTERRSGVTSERHGPRFDVVHMLWYAGALIVLGAMGIFSTTAFGLWGDRALLATALIYGALFLAAGAYLWRRNLRTPGGLLVTCAVGMTPLAIYALQAIYAHYPAAAVDGYRKFIYCIESSRLSMEMGTVAVALLALRFFPFPFLTMIIAFCLWFMSMDLPRWLGGNERVSLDEHATISLYFGLLVMAAAWLVDLRKWKNGDFAFWLHLSGVAAFWGGLTVQHVADEFGRAVYCAVNVGLIAWSIFLMRRVYAVFGAIGVTLYLGYLAAVVFANSILFSFALSAIGVALIAFGILFHEYGGAISAAVDENLPVSLRQLRPSATRTAA